MGTDAARPRPRSMGDERLIEALEGPDCPLCLLVIRAGREFLEGILFESVNDVGFRERFTQGGGFCVRHTRVLVEIDRAQTETAVASAILLRSMLKGRRRSLEAARGHRRRTDRVREAVRPAWGCPACAQEAIVLRHSLERLAQHSAADDDWHATVHAATWCLDHMADMERELTSSGRGLGVDFLESQLRRLEKLDSRLEGLAHHSAFDRRGQLTADERQSVADAMRTVAGREG